MEGLANNQPERIKNEYEVLMSQNQDGTLDIIRACHLLLALDRNDDDDNRRIPINHGIRSAVIKFIMNAEERRNM